MKKIFLVTLKPTSHRTSEENLGILYLASNLRNNGYNVEIVDGWLNELDNDVIFKKIISEETLFVGFSSYMTNTLPTVNMIKKIKEFNKNINVVCGGYGPTFYPKEYLSIGADIVSLGEGEETLVEIAEYYSGKRSIDSIRSICYMNNDEFIRNEIRPLLDNLDILPFPSRDTLDTALKHKSSISVATSRGCSGNCEFCSIISFFRLANGKCFRTRSIKNIVDEIESLYNNGIDFIKVVDDSFIDGERDENWCKDFANEIKKRNIKVHLRGQIRADKINETIISYLSKAGFFSFSCGIENGSKAALRRMNKKASLKDNQNAIDLFNKYNLIMQMGFILFDKYTTMEELEENYKFLLKNNSVVTKGIFSEMYSAEGTKLNSKLKKEGELVESSFIDNNNKYKINDPKVQKVYDSLKQWHKSHSYIYDKLIDPITAPKAIGLDRIYKLYNLFLKVKDKDLEIFKYVLENVKNGIDFNIDLKIEENNDFYEWVDNETNLIYEESGLSYNADLNPFILRRNKNV